METRVGYLFGGLDDYSVTSHESSYDWRDEVVETVVPGNEGSNYA